MSSTSTLSRWNPKTASLLVLAAHVWLASCASKWVDVWAAMPQLTEPQNLPPAPFNQTTVVFADSTIRQTIRIGLSAPTIRLQISNAFGTSDLALTAVSVALPANTTGSGAGSSSIAPGTSQAVTFSGGLNYTIPGGALAFSDPLAYPTTAGQILTVTLYLRDGQLGNGGGGGVVAVTSHPGSRTTSFFAPGNQVDATDLAPAGLQSAEHWYFLSGVSGWIDGAAQAVAVLGDSITDGRGSTTNGNDRWPDVLQDRLRASTGTSAAALAVLNQAAGGNRVLTDGLGPNALARLDRDVLARPSVGFALVFEGINDIGTAPVDAATQANVGARLMGGLAQMVSRLHGARIAVVGCTITPFSGPGQTYSDAERERTRQRVNAWIRDGGRFDAVVDFDAVVRDPANETQLRAEFNTGDFLHLNPAGYKAMAEAVDLSVFETFANGVDSMT